MPWPLVPTRAKRDRKPSGVNHCRRDSTKELRPGQPAEHHALQCSECHRSFGGSKEGAEAQGKPRPALLGCLGDRSTHPAEIFIIKGFGEEQAQQLQLSLAGHRARSGWGAGGASPGLRLSPAQARASRRTRAPWPGACCPHSCEIHPF